jgi:hypothetical protein
MRNRALVRNLTVLRLLEDVAGTLRAASEHVEAPAR